MGYVSYTGLMFYDLAFVIATLAVIILIIKARRKNIENSKDTNGCSGKQSLVELLSIIIGISILMLIINWIVYSLFTTLVFK